MNIVVFDTETTGIPQWHLMRKAGFEKFKTPNLGEAVKMLLNREHIGAHRAMADAVATKDLYFALRGNPEFMAAGSAFHTNKAKEASTTP